MGNRGQRGFAEATGTISLRARIEEYQLAPVAGALAMPRVNLLIADDVGLGKTTEAGLVIEEMLLWHRARRVMVVCPASLTLKWRHEWRRISAWTIGA